MTKEEKLYLKQVAAWKKTQLLSIESCAINIEHLRKSIAQNKKMLRAELEERKLKVKTLVAVLKQSEKIK